MSSVKSRGGARSLAVLAPERSLLAVILWGLELGLLPWSREPGCFVGTCKIQRDCTELRVDLRFDVGGLRVATWANDQAVMHKDCRFIHSTTARPIMIARINENQHTTAHHSVMFILILYKVQIAYSIMVL